ncbi:C40 family peptidase [Guyparkeria sp.]
MALLGGCATQMGPTADTTGGPDSAAAETADPENLPYNPLQTIDTRSGMHTRSEEVVVQAVSQLGTPYRWGGESAESGFDCSGLTQYAFQAADIDLPRTSYQQYRATSRVERDELRPGDLVFFRLKGKRVDHVGIYVGENRFVHAPSRGKDVSFARLDNVYWSRNYIGAGRVPEADQLQLASQRMEDFTTEQ